MSNKRKLPHTDKKTYGPTYVRPVYHPPPHHLQTKHKTQKTERTTEKYNNATYLLDVSGISTGNSITPENRAWETDDGHYWEWDYANNSNVISKTNETFIIGWGEVLANKTFMGQVSVSHNDIIYVWSKEEVKDSNPLTYTYQC